MPILGTTSQPIPIAVSLTARRLKGGREWFYSILILGIVLLQGPEKRSQPTTKSKRSSRQFPSSMPRPVYAECSTDDDGDDR